MKILQMMIICLIGLFMASVSYAENIYLSPVGKLKAVVAPASKNCNESQIKIYKNGKLLLSKNYFSKDCNHGAVVEHAAWSSNACFFVFGMYSSGGHQPWHSYISFYNRNSNSIIDLDDYLYPISDTKFTLVPPDSIRLTILTPFPATKNTSTIFLPITFRLKDIAEGAKF